MTPDGTGVGPDERNPPRNVTAASEAGRWGT
jgi:hypothetical protein